MKFVKNKIFAVSKASITQEIAHKPKFDISYNKHTIDGVEFEPAEPSRVSIEFINMVKKLRELTGAGMMDCKKALVECEGNMERAIEYLRRGPYSRFGGI